MTPNYPNEKIYKLISDETDFVYVGSTIQSLSKRFYQHKQSAKNEKVKSKVYQVMREVGIESFRIILIKDYPCEREEQLTAEEERCRKIEGENILNTHRCYANVPYGLEAKEYQALYHIARISDNKSIKIKIPQTKKNPQTRKETHNKWLYKDNNHKIYLERQKQWYADHREDLLERAKIRSKINYQKKKDAKLLAIQGGVTV